MLSCHTGFARQGELRKPGNQMKEKREHATHAKIAHSLASPLFPGFFISNCFDRSFCLPNSCSKSPDALHLCSEEDYNNLAESI